MFRFFRSLYSMFRIGYSTLYVCIRVLLIARRDPKVALEIPRQRWAPHMLKIAQAKLDVDGLEQIDLTQPHIFVMNHQSLIDIPVAFMALPINICFVAKKELESIPFFGRAMKNVGMIFVDRRDPKRAIESMKSGGELIRSGINVMAFPEGTRSKDGLISTFKRGIFLLALEARVPIIPMAIVGADQVLSPIGFDLRAGLIKVKIGKPIETNEYQSEDITTLREVVRNAVIDLNLSIGGRGSR